MSAFTPDITRRDDPVYWGAALLQALKDHDEERQELCQKRLLALGYEVFVKATGKAWKPKGGKSA